MPMWLIVVVVAALAILLYIAFGHHGMLVLP